MYSYYIRPSENDNDEERLEGASVYPSDLNYVAGPTSAHHPWQCSLRTRGFRGRHRCGVTLLSGPTEQSPSDPWVLVGTAHCNYICKDGVTGDPLETCCCRPTDNDSSCKDVRTEKNVLVFNYPPICARQVLSVGSSLYLAWPLLRTWS